jgi:hypothetical protein
MPASRRYFTPLDRAHSPLWTEFEENAAAAVRLPSRRRRWRAELADEERHPGSREGTQKYPDEPDPPQVGAAACIDRCARKCDYAVCSPLHGCEVVGDTGLRLARYAQVVSDFLGRVCIGAIRERQTLDYELDPGSHTLQLRIDWCYSRPLAFTVLPAGTLRCQCRAARGPVFLLDMFFRRHDYPAVDELSDPLSTTTRQEGGG